MGRCAKGLKGNIVCMSRSQRISGKRLEPLRFNALREKFMQILNLL